MIYPIERDNTVKAVLIPNVITVMHVVVIKVGDLRALRYGRSLCPIS